jgi:hypothetical protein
MNEKYIKITGNNQVYKLIVQTPLPGHKIQMVVDSMSGERFVFTRQSGCYKVVAKPIMDEYED